MPACNTGGEGLSTCLPAGWGGRLAIYTLILVVPLIFYVYVREHYWTTKFAAFQFLFLFGLIWTWSAWGRPRYRFPLAWPAVLYVFWASLALLVCVNTGEANRYYLWTCAAPWLAWLAYQHIDTVKRIHVAMICMALMAFGVYSYGIKQAYLLFYPLLEFASTPEAVSTGGNVNFAAYIIDLTFPILVGLAAVRRKGWWVALSFLFLMLALMGRLHLALCDSRASRLSLTLSLPMMLLIVWWYMPTRSRIILLAVGFELLFKAIYPGLNTTRYDTWHTRRTYEGAHSNYAAYASNYRKDPSEANKKLVLDAGVLAKQEETKLDTQTQRVIWLFICLAVMAGLGLLMLYQLDRQPGCWYCLAGVLALPWFLYFAGLLNGTRLGDLFSPPAGTNIIKWWLSDQNRWLVAGTLWLLGVTVYQSFWGLAMQWWNRNPHDWLAIRRRTAITIGAVSCLGVLGFGFFVLYNDTPAGELFEAYGPKWGAIHTLLWPFQDTLIDLTADGPTIFRLQVWRESCEKIKDNPFFGVGPGNFKVVEPLYESMLERRVLGKEVLGRNPHNDYLYYAVEYGCGALLTTLWSIACVFFCIFSALALVKPATHRQGEFFNCFLWGLLWAILHLTMRANLEMPLYQPSSTVLYWIYLGLALQCYRLAQGGLPAYASPPAGAFRPWRFFFWPQHFRQGVHDLALLKPSVSQAPINLTPQVEKTDARPTGRRGVGRPNTPVFTPAAAPLTPRISIWPELPPAGPSLGWKLVRWPVFIIALLVLWGGLFSRQFTGESLGKWMMNLRDFGGGQFNLVQEAFDRSVKIYPQEMETYYIYGRYCIDAVSEIDKVVPPGTEPTEEQKKQLARMQLRYEDRQTWIERGIKALLRDLSMNPNYKWAHNNLGVLYDKAQDIDKAREYYLRALAVDDRQVYALFNTGMGYMRKGTTKLQTLQQVASKPAEEINQLQEDALTDFRLAIPFFKRTLRVEPERTDVEKYLDLCSNHVQAMEARASLAKLQSTTQEMDNAQEVADKIQKLLQDRDWPAAEHLITQAEGRWPQLVAFKIQKAVLAAGQGNLDNAEAILQNLVALAGPQTPASVYFYLARFAALRPDQAKALENVKKCLQADRAGYLKKIKEDGILKSLHALPDFKQALSEAENVKAAS